MVSMSTWLALPMVWHYGHLLSLWRLLTNSEHPDEILHNTAFYQGPYCLLKHNQSWTNRIQYLIGNYNINIYLQCNGTSWILRKIPLDLMRGSRKFFQRGPILITLGERGSKYHYKRADSGPILNADLVILWFYRASGPVLLIKKENPHFCDFSGGSRPPVFPPLDPPMSP